MTARELDTDAVGGPVHVFDRKDGRVSWLFTTAVAAVVWRRHIVEVDKTPCSRPLARRLRADGSVHTIYVLIVGTRRTECA